VELVVSINVLGGAACIRWVDLPSLGRKCRPSHSMQHTAWCQLQTACDKQAALTTTYFGSSIQSLTGATGYGSLVLLAPLLLLVPSRRQQVAPSRCWQLSAGVFSPRGIPL